MLLKRPPESFPSSPARSSQTPPPATVWDSGPRIPTRLQFETSQSLNPKTYSGYKAEDHNSFSLSTICQIRATTTKEANTHSAETVTPRNTTNALTPDH